MGLGIGELFCFTEYRNPDILRADMDRLRILIVEDDIDLRRLFRSVLSLAGYDVTEAGDGVDALHAIDLAPPDLVVLDLQLLALDGLSVQQELAARAATRNVPIVIVTGSDLVVEADNVVCLLRKPVSPDRLLGIVQHSFASTAPAIRRRSSSRPPEPAVS